MTSHRSSLAARFLLAFIVALTLLQRPTTAEPKVAPVPDAAELKVVTKVAPPFAMKSDDGQWSGLAIDLMSQIAQNLSLKVKWSEVETTAELLNDITERKDDAAIAAITMTSEREKTVDFSHGYYDSGLAIAVKRNHGASFWSGIEALASPAFLGTVGLLVALLFATGAIIWLIEHRQNAEQFEKHPLRGIGSGFWWSAVTMTTVGYGDKAPITPLGRFLAVIWMFAALILTAVFTAQLTSTLTLHRLSGPVTGVADLGRSRVGVVANTASNAYFDQRAIPTTHYPDVKFGLAALDAGVIDAFVHDEPLLRYDIRQHYRGTLELLPQVFDNKVYAIVLQPGSPLTEKINRALLETIASPAWTAMKAKYFGNEVGDN